MNPSRLFVCSAVLSAALIAPAHAELKNVGTVYLGGSTGPATYGDAFPAPVERLGFKAVHGSVTCDSIRATLADGSTHELFKGPVGYGASEVNAPGGTIRRIDFQCQGNTGMAGIGVMVEIGRHEPAWRAHSDWNGKWWYRIAPNEPVATQGANRS